MAYGTFWWGEPGKGKSFELQMKNVSYKEEIQVTADAVEDVEKEEQNQILNRKEILPKVIPTLTQRRK